MPSSYNIQCLIHGYCGQVTQESNPELYAKCQKREADGFSDAFTVGPGNDFCSDCREDHARHRQDDLNYLQQIQDPYSPWYIEHEKERAQMVQRVRKELRLSCDE